MNLSDNKWSGKAKTLAASYEKELRRYLGPKHSGDLQSALRLGRRAVAIKLETLDMAAIHEHALLQQIQPVDTPAAVRAKLLKLATMFFAEAITPLEEGHRGAIEFNNTLSQINEELNQRTLDLVKSNQQLKKEIARRKVVEKTLRESQQQTIELLEQSRLLQTQLRMLSRNILRAQEDERKRISRELHDVVVQLLTGINVQLTILKNESLVSTKELSRKISDAQRLVVKSVDIVHRFARELRPSVLDDLGLMPALHTFMKSFMEESGVRVTLTAFEGVEKLSNTKRTVVYRVVQEALTNVARHAHAGRVDVCIEKIASAVRIHIKDDGRGFDLKKLLRAKKIKHLGVLGMRERVEMVRGTFKIESAPEQGTTILIQIPFKNGVKKKAST
ncbi:MAG: histidine kinase [Kiritimatiellae bacterium]|nr:histidine kinase [Kiritimatiellia bacterium]